MNYVDRCLDRLSKVLKPFSEEQVASAAVASLLRVADQDLKVLFVKRVENSADPWSGQMAFPGGKRDVKDQNLRQTVVRETLEETGINLLEGSRFLGVTDTVKSTILSEMTVLPFVILLEREAEIKLNKKELKDFVWVSLKELARHKDTVKFTFGEFPAYSVGNSVIWGLTYSIVEKFAQAINLN